MAEPEHVGPLGVEADKEVVGLLLVAMAFADVRIVAARLGHAYASTTLWVYAHALPERDRDAAGILGRALSPSKEATDG